MNEKKCRTVAKVLWTVFCKSRGNSGVTASTSRHWKPQESSIINVKMIPLRANITRVSGSPCLGAVGASVWGVALAGCRFLCAGKCSAQLSMSGTALDQHPAHEGVTFPGTLFMTWRAQGVVNGWLLVFLSRMCCHKAASAIARLSGCSEESLHVTASWWLFLTLL